MNMINTDVNSLKEYSMVRELTITVSQDIDDFIFTTILPFSEEVTEMKISKKWLEDALLMKKRVDEMKEIDLRYDSVNDLKAIGWNNCLRAVRGEARE